MARSAFRSTSYFPHGLLAVALVGLLFGLFFQRQLKAESQTEHPAVISENGAVAANVKSSPDEVFLRLAGSVGQTVPAERLLAYKRRADPESRTRYWAIVDFNQSSTRKRLYVFDTVESKVNAFYVSHGRGSEGSVDDGIADTFSNQDGSLASSLGIYRTLGEYDGKHGRSLRLEGVEPTNSNVLARGVVLHTADYVSEDFIRQTGRLGRSEGCFAVDKAVGNALIDELKGGAYIIAWKS
jgi:hypothetical protein